MEKSFSCQSIFVLKPKPKILFVYRLIPATLSANSAMMKTLSGKKETEDTDVGKKAGDSFDPTVMETKYRTYVETGVGANGPTLPFSSLLFATEPVKLVDIIAIVSVEDTCFWKNEPYAEGGFTCYTLMECECWSGFVTSDF